MYSFKIWEVGFVCTYWFVRIFTEKCLWVKLSKYGRKYFLSHTARIKTFYSFKIWNVGFVGTSGLFVFLHSRTEMRGHKNVRKVTVKLKILVCSYSLQITVMSLYVKTRFEVKCPRNGLKLSKYEMWISYFTGLVNIAYLHSRIEMFYSLSKRFEKWVSWVPTGLFVFSGLENRKMSRNGLKLSKYVRK